MICYDFLMDQCHLPFIWNTSILWSQIWVLYPPYPSWFLGCFNMNGGCGWMGDVVIWLFYRFISINNKSYGDSNASNVFFLVLLHWAQDMIWGACTTGDMSNITRVRKMWSWYWFRIYQLSIHGLIWIEQPFQRNANRAAMPRSQSMVQSSIATFQ